MDTAFWTAVAAVVAVVTLGGALMLHVNRYAYQRGTSDQRISELERRAGETTAIAPSLAALQATVAALTQSIERLDRVVERLEERSRRGGVMATV